MNDESHEIGNILGILIGNAELLLYEDLGQTSREMAEDIHSAALRLRKLLAPGSIGQTG